MKATRRKIFKGLGGASIVMMLANCESSNSNESIQSKQAVKSSRGKKKYDAIVVDAGLSGLNAAMHLEAAGMDVLVLEGRKRIWGQSIYSYGCGR